MAAFILHLIILTTSLQGLAAQPTNGSVSVGASLPATPDAKPWLSPSGEFAFGFQQVQGNDNFLLSIWYDKIPDKTIVWYPRNGPMVSQGSKVELTNGLGLVLSDPQGRQVWSSGSISDLAYGHGAMNDTGNFMLVGSDSRKKWESFNFPADTLLPTQIMVRNGSINSKMSETNFTGGRFELRLLEDGNLVLNSVDLFSESAADAYYISDTKGSSSTNSGDKLILDTTGYMYILKRNGERSDLTVRDSIPSGDYYFRATLDSDGVFTQYYYPKNPTGKTSWEVIWFEPEDICRKEGSRACGLNSVCSLIANRPTCECPQRFSLFDSNDPYGDCKPDFSPSCDESYGEDQFDFTELNDIDWPQSHYIHLNPTNAKDCKTSCLKDCFCAVAVYSDKQCWKKTLPLSNGMKNNTLNVMAFLKYRKGDRPHGGPPRFSGEKKDRQSLIIAGSALFGTSVFVNIVLSVLICFGIFLIYKKKIRKVDIGGTSVETSVIRFKYNELVQATNRFKDELGKGAFAIVYKGVIGTNTVAVKKLDRMVEDNEREFRTEVNAIARTHHKNLVQLLGFCNDGEQRLLVYEYMSNGTLASFLFGNMRPSWSHRCNMAFGIAKGLSYLHEECSTQIIHCDIKPQNILLDEYYNVRISDFGLAKLLLMNQSRTNTGIRGTKGYVAPEWFRNTPVTAKVDVYSFGVLLLEIISCRKSVKGNESGDEYGAILTDWAWDCYQGKRLDVLVENDSEALEDVKKLKTFVMVGLWCIQENPSLRPTMRMVIQMLEGIVDVNEPPCPSPFSISLS